VTIPAAIRRHLGVTTGDRVVFAIEPDGSVRVKTPRFPTVASLRGAAGILPRPMTWKEMREAAREERAARKFGVADE